MGNMVRAQAERYLEKQLRDPAGKARIGQTMIEPIRKGRDYVGIARKCLFVDKIPTGAPMWYDKDPDIVATKLSKRGGVPYQQVEGERVELTPYAITAYVRIPVLEVAVRRFNILDREQIRARAEMAAAEDVELFRILKSIFFSDAFLGGTKFVLGASDTASAFSTVKTNDGTWNPVVYNVANGVTGGATLNKTGLAQLFAEIEKWDAPVATVLMHVLDYKAIRSWDYNDFDPVTMRELLKTGYYGDIWGAQIRCSRKLEPGAVYGLADPEFTGVQSIRLDLDQQDAQDPENMLLGWIFYEYISQCILNNYAVSCLRLAAAPS